jgi:limonene-1,2-epoxide hydrolase
MDDVRESNTVERYLECLVAHDWDGLAATIADQGLVRDGPFHDVVEGKEPYLAFLRSVMTSLAGYQLTVQRVSHVSDHVSYVELTETVAADGVPTD